MDKEKLKQEIIQNISKNPESFIPVEELKANGFQRYKCKSCGKYFWSTKPRDYCGNPECVGGYTFLTSPIVKENISLSAIWKKFSLMFQSFGHKEIKRYPVVAWWRDDLYFVEAAIDDFAPYVIDGVAEPPENPLVIAQPCVRFDDIENVGATGRHLTTFIMAEQAAFNTPNQQTYFDKEAWMYIYKWLINGLHIPQDQLTFVEDAWVGAGYAGNSLEYFAGGLELGNQVYMRFRIIENGLVPIKVKTIDMGAGLERWGWILNNTPTVYEITFPNTIKYLKEKIGINLDEKEIRKIYEFLGKFDYESYPLEKAVEEYSNNNNLEYEKILHEVRKLRYIYSLADHLRTLILAIYDGSLPSNIGGGYNLRYLIRRLITQKRMENIKVDILDVIPEIKKDMDMFPEVSNFDPTEIINLEEKRFDDLLEKNKKIIDKVIKEGADDKTLATLYSSYGIRPEDIVLRAQEIGKNVNIGKIELQKEKKKEIKIEKKYDFPATEKLFYETESTEGEATILYVNGNEVILDKTIFYPEMGGQKADHGFIDNAQVVDVQIYGGVIVHYINGELNKKPGEKVKLKVDEKRRESLRKHHTATHILNGSARKILGEFVHQFGAEKDENIAHLDVTFYRMPTQEEIDSIEKLANEEVQKDEDVKIMLMNRTEAEKQYGMQIYQGGVAPEKTLRIVKIGEFDVEACGGLHCKRTGEIGFIKILEVTKVQDGVIRFTFVAGEKAIEAEQSERRKIKEIEELLGSKDIVKETSEIFEKYKSYKNKFEKSEMERILAIMDREKQINSYFEDVIGLLNKLPKDKDFVIIGKNNGIAKNTQENKEILLKYFKNIKERGEYLLAY